METVETPLDPPLDNNAGHLQLVSTVYLLKIRHFLNNFISGLPNKIN